MAMTRTLLFAVYVIGVGAQTRADSSVPSSAEAVGILRPKDFGIEFNDNIAGSNVPEEATTSKGSVKGTMSEGVMTAAANTDRRSGALLQREAKLSKAAASSMRKRGAQAGGASNKFIYGGADGKKRVHSDDRAGTAAARANRLHDAQTLARREAREQQSPSKTAKVQLDSETFLLSARGKKASIQPNSLINRKGGIGNRGSSSVTGTDSKKRKALPSKKIDTGVWYLDNQIKDTQRKRVRGKTASESLKEHQQTSRRRRSAQKKRDSRASLNSEQIRTVATTNVTTTATNAATTDHRSERGQHATQSMNARENQHMNRAGAERMKSKKTGSQSPKHAKLGGEEGRRGNKNRRKGVRH